MKTRDNKRQFIVTANYIQEVRKKQLATQKDLEQLAERIDKMYMEFLLQLEKIK